MHKQDFLSTQLRCVYPDILVPAKPDYLSTLGIDYLRRNVETLVTEFNDFVQVDDDSFHETIKAEILGVVFTMVQNYGGQPIASLRPYINQTKELGIHVFKEYFKENKTFFASAPEAGFPVILQGSSNDTEKEIIQRIEDFTTEFIEKIKL